MTPVDRPEERHERPWSETGRTEAQAEERRAGADTAAALEADRDREAGSRLARGGSADELRAAAALEERALRRELNGTGLSERRLPRSAIEAALRDAWILTGRGRSPAYSDLEVAALHRRLENAWYCVALSGPPAGSQRPISTDGEATSPPAYVEPRVGDLAVVSYAQVGTDHRPWLDVVDRSGRVWARVPLGEGPSRHRSLAEAWAVARVLSGPLLDEPGRDELLEEFEGPALADLRRAAAAALWGGPLPAGLESDLVMILDVLAQGWVRNRRLLATLGVPARVDPLPLDEVRRLARNLENSRT